MSKDERKICPMMSYHRENYQDIYCNGMCAWYDHRYNECCLISITQHLGLMTEVCDGSRTLFVREC